MRIRPFLLAAVAAVGLSIPAQAEIIAHLGPINPGPAQGVVCNQSTCVSSQGVVNGSLPALGTFAHHILFNVPIEAGVITSTQILNGSQYDVPNLSMRLFALNPISPVNLGAIPTLGALLSDAGAPFGNAPTVNFALAFAGLVPGGTYAIEFRGAGAGVTGPGASYAQQISVSPVPLPAAVWLLGAALCGMVGYARMRHRRNESATA